MSPRGTRFRLGLRFVPWGGWKKGATRNNLPNLTLLMLPAVLAFPMVLFGMFSLIMVAKRKHLVDEPSESRKRTTVPSRPWAG